ncbi:MAG: biliverdin-producing heme oxygenase [Flammeovirgaceae bacterium]
MLPLKEATSAKHKLAERMPFNARMFRGLLTKEQYLMYLTQQLQIFQAIEQIGLPHESLKRIELIQSDIDELNAEGYSANMILASTKAYSDYLSSLSYQEVLPHIYLNYLALVFGGQMMKKSVPSAGRMYTFDNMQDAVQSIRAVQNDNWADEVNKGFDYNISIFEELEAECLVTK